MEPSIQSTPSAFRKLTARLNSAQFIFNDVSTCLDDFWGHHSPEDVISLALSPSLCIERPFAPGLAAAYFSICNVVRDLFSLTKPCPHRAFKLLGNMCIE
ncbi:hypothetical protein PAPYR_245 [Paratrimastix pyriformis]|uniref:Uncharacterized protein n=1 Tax=Paratrimastix pyriformis TaxID=342808 RepID=A0ABQ8U933_9EUKA|nr:hypothetical protein PAPYR_10235 [Paratrimastix pyriformis]KAJ4460345.1 hypothetical protein PAPYR_3357 [Paratrimastix pyriformis]KAJ4463008.1 hypothetical protein PAPYR_245 [Paratrimastix pyriformis]